MKRPLLLLLVALVASTAQARVWTYSDAIKKDYKPSDYDWNALSTRWINMRAIALIGIDAAHFDQDAANEEQVGDMSRYDRFDVRGLRIGLGGTINFDRPWSYLLSLSVNSVMQDFDRNTADPVSILDALVSIPLWGSAGRMQVGKMKEPFSMERSMGLVFEQVMERPMHIDAFSPTRNIGVTLSDTLLDEKMTWRGGVFNDWLDRRRPDFSDNDQQYIFRVTGVPYENLLFRRLLHLGLSYRYDDLREGSVRYDVGPEFYFSDPWLDTGRFEANHAETTNVEFTWLQGPWWIASEFSKTSVDAPQHGDPSFEGWHAASNCVVTGEHRGYTYRRGIVRRVKPERPVGKGGWGALEISGRYSWLDLDDGDIRGGKMGIWSLGAIWHPVYEMQFHVQWSRATLEGQGALPPGETEKSDANIFQFRWVLLID
jgi:phosphate-selective porin OprO/OprP